MTIEFNFITISIIPLYPSPMCHHRDNGFIISIFLVGSNRWSWCAKTSLSFLTSLCLLYLCRSFIQINFSLNLLLLQNLLLFSTFQPQPIHCPLARATSFLPLPLQTQVSVVTGDSFLIFFVPFLFLLISGYFLMRRR